MHLVTVQEALKRQPFEAFTLRLNDTRKFYIPHPEFATVTKHSVLIVNEENGALLHLEPGLIASQEYDAPTAST